jgi:uncharacterized protein with ParB-like and HNH nuclease domain
VPKTDIAVRELIDKVAHGELLLPEMQRRYVWPATRVRDLLDSLYRGYPSGTILVWETDQEISAGFILLTCMDESVGSVMLVVP